MHQEIELDELFVTSHLQVDVNGVTCWIPVITGPSPVCEHPWDSGDDYDPYRDAD